MKILFLLLFISTSNAFAINYFPTEAEFLNPHAHLIQFSGSYFKTTGFYDDQGTLTNLNSGDQFSMMNSDFKLRYGWSKKIEAAVSARLRSVSSVYLGNSVSQTGAESATVYLKYSFPPVGSLLTGIGVRYRQTLYTNTKYDPPQVPPVVDIVLGDDGREYAVDFFATYVDSSLKYIANFSYQSPPNNLSTEILYKFELRYTFTSLTLLAGVDGVSSLKNDPNTAATKSQISTGATHLFNSTDRELVAPYLGANYAFKSFAVGVLGQQVMKGVSTDAGSLMALNISFGSEGVTPESVKIGSFKEYHIDGSVLKVSARGNFLRIDQGLSSDVEKGMKFDIYQTDYFGGNVLVASGIILEVGADWSVVKLTKKYKDIEIKPGFAARGY